MRSEHPLSDDEIRAVVPSIFAPSPHGSRSERYIYIPSYNRAEYVNERKTIDAGMAGFIGLTRRMLPAASGLDRADRAVLLVQPEQTRCLHPACAAGGHASAGPLAARPAASWRYRLRVQVTFLRAAD